METERELDFEVPSVGMVSAILNQPNNSIGLFVFGHGSGSNIRVPLIARLAAALCDQRVATLRFAYPYSNQPNFIPYSDIPTDPDEILIATVRAAVSYAASVSRGVPLFAGGHSMSAYITSIADAENSLPVQAIISLSFPRKGDPARSAHFDRTTLPMLFIQGTKDTLVTEVEIDEIAATLGERATVRWIEDASHGFEVEGRENDDVIQEVATHICDYIGSMC